MLHENEKSGHRDLDGTWIDETPSAKLRNKLSSFWTLSTILVDEEMRDKFLKNDKGQKLLFDIAQRCEQSKDSILSLIDELSK